MDGSEIVYLINGSRPLGLTLDFISGRLYWTDTAGSVWESSFSGASVQAIYSNDDFVPFKITTVRNFILVTSRVNSSYALISSEDYSVSLVRTPPGILYFGVSVVSELRKPSLGELV